MRRKFPFFWVRNYLQKKEYRKNKLSKKKLQNLYQYANVSCNHKEPEKMYFFFLLSSNETDNYVDLDGFNNNRYIHSVSNISSMLLSWEIERPDHCLFIEFLILMWPFQIECHDINLVTDHGHCDLDWISRPMTSFPSSKDR